MSSNGSWFRIGHVTDEEGRTGCTVVVFDELVPAAVDVRGGAPGTRETDLLSSGRLVGRADAIVLTGGSAFGLAAADGVMRFLAERGRGIPTSAIPVPIVPAAVIFDLANGDAVWPTADDGYRAANDATPIDSSPAGRIGAGAGATVAKLGSGSRPGGLGIGSTTTGTVTVSAIVVLNAVGDIVDPATGRTLAGAIDATGKAGRELAIARIGDVRPGENTSIGVVLIDGPTDRDTLERCCIAAHDALARCVVPAHTLVDGDTFFAVARSDGRSTAVETLGIASAVELAVEQAIVSLFARDVLG